MSMKYTKIKEGMNDLESRLQSPEYLKPTVSVGARTAAETTIGYIAGRLYSQIG
ncbi:MAG: hypothetical protein ACLFNK_02795 [Candidatus Woesearchaeota archaeon]